LLLALEIISAGNYLTPALSLKERELKYKETLSPSERRLG